MKINHYAVYVKDLEKTKDFFIKYFGATSNKCYHNQKTGLKTYFLTFTCGGRLEIMSKPDITAEYVYDEHLGYIHLAFSTGSEDSVNMLNYVRLAISSALAR